MLNKIIRKEFFGSIIYSIMDNKITCNLDKKYNNMNKYLSAPISVFLELTDTCNLKCIHCFNGENRTDKILSVQTWKNIIDQLYDMNIFFVKITGGEPFLFPQIFEILHYLDLKQINYIIYTNGYYIENNIEEFKNLKHLIELRVSLEGTKKYNDYIRGEGNFDKVFFALKMLDLYDINYSINYTINKKNYRMLPELERYVSEGCKLNTKIHLGFIKYAGNTLINKELCFKNDKEYREAITYIEKIIYKSKIIEPLNMLPEYYYDICCDHFGCPAGQISVVIKYNGDVIPCGLMSGYKIAYCGNICQNNFKNIWNSNEMNRFRNLKCPTQCKQCVEFMKNCTGGCRANALNVFGDLTCFDINCYIYKTKFSRIKRFL